MEKVEERYIFIFTPIHTKMTFMDVANTNNQVKANGNERRIHLGMEHY